MIVSLALIGFLTYAGLPTYGIQETATSELVFEWMPGEGEGKVDEVPFDQLPAASCTWDSFTKSFTVCDEPALTPEARKLFEEFQSDVDRWLTLDKAFRRAERQRHADDRALAAQPAGRGDARKGRAADHGRWQAAAGDGAVHQPLQG